MTSFRSRVHFAAENFRAPRRSDRGFTLIELIVYSMLLLLVAAIAGSLIFGSTKTTKLVRSVTDATTLGQEIGKSVQRGVRNATAIKALTEPTVVAAGIAGTQLLVVETLGGGSAATTQCQAWFYVPSHGGQIFLKTVSPLAAIVAPNVSYIEALAASTAVTAPPGWTTWGEGINKDGPVPFTQTGKQIGISLSVTAGTSTDVKNVKLVSTAASRQPTVGTASSCF